MTKLLEQAVAEVALLPEEQQDAIAAHLLADIEAERAWSRAFAETTEDDLDHLVAFARSQQASAMPVEAWLRRCEAKPGSST